MDSLTTYSDNDASTAHPNLSDLGRRFGRLVTHSDTLPEADFKKCSRKGAHSVVSVKNPRTLLDVLRWTDQDRYSLLTS